MAVSAEFKEPSSKEEIELWESSPVDDIMIECLQNLHQTNAAKVKVGISNNSRWAFRYEKIRGIRNRLTKHNLKTIPEFFVVGLGWV